MLGLYPTGTRSLGTFNRKTTGPVFFRLVAAGFASMSAVASAQASSVVTSAGNGAAAFTSFNGRGALSSVGLGVLAATIAVKSSSVITIAGTGVAALQLASSARSVVSCNGSAAFVPVMSAKVSSSVTMQGSSSFGGSDSPGTAIAFNGVGSFIAVGYALFADAEKAGPAYEQRVVYALGESRAAVAPSEDRVYYVSSKSASPGPPNRRRVL